MKTLTALLLLAMAADTASTAESPEKVQPSVLICGCLPEYPGGEMALLKHLSKYISYNGYTTSDTAERCVRVIARFDIDTCGNITNVRIAKGDNLQLNNAVTKAINNMDSFIPCPDQWVPVTFNLPVKISLQR